MRQRACSHAVRGTAAAPGPRGARAAQAAAGRMLYNTAEMDRGPLGEGDTVAILEGTQLCCTRQLRDLLHCLGGIPVLLPLFAQLGETTTPRCIPLSSALPQAALQTAIGRDAHVDNACRNG